VLHENAFATRLKLFLGPAGVIKRALGIKTAQE
jgi:hypothetical protein